MRPHPTLRRLAAGTGAAFRCAERLAAYEGLAARLAPDLQAGPLVAEGQLRGLVEPADGSTALRRVLGRVGAPLAGGRSAATASESAGPEWIPLGRVASSQGDVATAVRPSPRPPRPPRKVSPIPGWSPAPPLAMGLGVSASLQAILDASAPSSAGGGGHAPRSGSPAPWIGTLDPRGPEADLRAGDDGPLGPAAGASFLGARAALTPVLIEEPGAALAALLTGAGTKPGTKPAHGAEPTERKAPTRAPALTSKGTSPYALDGAADPARSSAPRGVLTPPPLSAPTAVGGFRGLAGLAASVEAGSPLAVEGRTDEAPLRSSHSLDPSFRSALAGAGQTAARPYSPVSRLASPDIETLAPWRTDSGSDLEAALDQALRRAARRHGIEVLEP